MRNFRSGTQLVQKESVTEPFCYCLRYTFGLSALLSRPVKEGQEVRGLFSNTEPSLTLKRTLLVFFVSTLSL